MAGIPVTISFGGKTAAISPNGELFVREIEYSDPIPAALTDTTVKNYVTPAAQMLFIWTGMLISGDRSIAANGDVFELWEASDNATTSQDTLLLSVDIARQQVVPFITPSTKITEGKFVNGDRTGTSGIITATMFGYFIDRLD